MSGHRVKDAPSRLFECAADARITSTSRSTPRSRKLARFEPRNMRRLWPLRPEPPGIVRSGTLRSEDNGKLRYLWRAVDHEGEVLEAVVTSKRNKAAALKLLKRIMKKYGRPRSRHRPASCVFRGDGRGRQRRSAPGRWPPQQSGGEFASAVSNTRTGDAAVSKSEDAAEVQLSSRPGPQPIQSGAPSRHKANLQAETLCCLGRVARSRGIDPRSRDGGRAACRRASVTLTPPAKALGQREFFKSYTEATRRVADGEVEVLPLEAIAETTPAT
jgi:DDE domain